MNFNKICGNCGIKGHIYKECTGPITSIGIIAFRQNKKDTLDKIFHEYLKDTNPDRDKNLKVLLIQRKDTMGFIDFIRGKYPEKNKTDYLKVYLSEMIPEEVESLRTKHFDQLWDELWYDHTSKYYKNDKKEAKEKFNQINLKELLENCTDSKWKYQEFGLPKGRRNLKENFKDCAIREFEEETNYTPDEYTLLDELGNIEEEFTGSNGVRYKHIYFIAKVKNDAKLAKMNSNNLSQLNEIKNIGWFTESEALFLIREYNIEKKSVIKKSFQAIEMYNQCYNFEYIRSFLRLKSFKENNK